MSTAESYVVVGASAAGVSAAFAIRGAGATGPVTIVDADPNLPYERPPLSKSVLGGASPLRPIRPAADYANTGIELLLGSPVAAVNPGPGTVGLADGSTLKADRVVLTTGVRARRLTVPGADLGNILVLRDAADAAALATRLAAGGPLVVVGGGFIGLELAAVALEQGIRPTVVELAPLPLLGVLGEPIAELVRRRHHERGVELVLGTTVERFVGRGAVEEVVLADGRRRPAATVVVGVGVEPRDELAVAAGLGTDRAGIVVDRHGTTSDPRVWAAGDVASQPHPALPERGRIEHWDAALRHGEAVGASAAGVPTTWSDPPYAWSDQFGTTYQMLGRRHPGDTIVLREDSGPERLLAFWLREGRLVAALGLDAGREIGALRRLIGSAPAVPAHLLADPATDLRRVAKEWRAAG
ncbi:NAD(P)/FAD-dependent oxidoreductase [Pseudonocardia sp. GCM10023141]|uniref:NAD(P)/FAD-dependent oxidoreductase n=1 Tax=Pseudonocardia sp. GCM10023141 TaxID=3252653 RepID=UPI00361A3554